MRRGRGRKVVLILILTRVQRIMFWWLCFSYISLASFSSLSPWTESESERVLKQEQQNKSESGKYINNNDIDLEYISNDKLTRISNKGYKLEAKDLLKICQNGNLESILEILFNNQNKNILNRIDDSYIQDYIPSLKMEKISSIIPLKNIFHDGICIFKAVVFKNLASDAFGRIVSSPVCRFLPKKILNFIPTELYPKIHPICLNLGGQLNEEFYHLLSAKVLSRLSFKNVPFEKLEFSKLIYLANKGKFHPNQFDQVKSKQIYNLLKSHFKDCSNIQINTNNPLASFLFPLIGKECWNSMKSDNTIEITLEQLTLLPSNSWSNVDSTIFKNMKILKEDYLINKISLFNTNTDENENFIENNQITNDQDDENIQETETKNIQIRGSSDTTVNIENDKNSSNQNSIKNNFKEIISIHSQSSLSNNLSLKLVPILEQIGKENGDSCRWFGRILFESIPTELYKHISLKCYQSMLPSHFHYLEDSEKLESIPEEALSLLSALSIANISPLAFVNLSSRVLRIWNETTSSEKNGDQCSGLQACQLNQINSPLILKEFTTDCFMRLTRHTIINLKSEIFSLLPENILDGFAWYSKCPVATRQVLGTIAKNSTLIQFSYFGNESFSTFNNFNVASMNSLQKEKEREIEGEQDKREIEMENENIQNNPCYNFHIDWTLSKSLFSSMNNFCFSILNLKSYQEMSKESLKIMRNNILKRIKSKEIMKSIPIHAWKNIRTKQLEYLKPSACQYFSLGHLKAISSNTKFLDPRCIAKIKVQVLIDALDQNIEFPMGFMEELPLEKLRIIKKSISKIPSKYSESFSFFESIASVFSSSKEKKNYKKEIVSNSLPLDQDQNVQDQDQDDQQE